LAKQAVQLPVDAVIVTLQALQFNAANVEHVLDAVEQ